MKHLLLLLEPLITLSYLSYIDIDVIENEYYYKISSTDHNENEGIYSDEVYVNLLKLDDLDTGSIADGKVLSYQASTGKLVFSTASSATNLVDLSDVDDSALADDTIMVYNSSTGKFEFTTSVDGGTVT